ncbi:MAG: carboxypeptidase regulatory-like domain-containing protein [Armatimonadota bacterium]
MLVVTWPQTAQSRLITTTCQSVQVTVTGPGITTPVTQVINTPATTVDLMVPAGLDRVVDAQGFDAPDAGGTQIQEAYAPFTVGELKPGAIVPVTLYLGDMADPADDVYLGATPITTDGTPSALCVSDALGQDWQDSFRFAATGGEVYLISTRNVVGMGSGGYYLQVVDPTVPELLVQGPLCPDTDTGWLLWVAPADGDYVACVANDLTGQLEYRLSVAAGGSGGSAIWGYVTDDTGAPVAGALVAVSDGNTLFTSTSRADGAYLILGVPVGARVVSFDMAGYRTTCVATTIGSATDWVRVDGVLSFTESPCPPDAPVITIASANVDQELGFARVLGQIQGVQADTAILVLNGSEQIIPLQGGQGINAVVFLTSGNNVIVIRASNCRGNSLSPPIPAQWTATFIFRVTLTWDATTDMDLHMWGPGLGGSTQHCYYSRSQIDAGELDYDNTSGYGPENFTARTLIPGRYAIGANFYSGGVPVGCTIRVTAPATGATDLGPHTLTTPNYNDGYPIAGTTSSWWRAADIIVAADGSVSVVAPDIGVAYSRSLAGALGGRSSFLKPPRK